MYVAGGRGCEDEEDDDFVCGWGAELAGGTAAGAACACARCIEWRGDWCIFDEWGTEGEGSGATWACARGIASELKGGVGEGWRRDDVCCTCGRNRGCPDEEDCELEEEEEGIDKLWDCGRSIGVGRASVTMMGGGRAAARSALRRSLSLPCDSSTTWDELLVVRYSGGRCEFAGSDSGVLVWNGLGLRLWLGMGGWR